MTPPIAGKPKTRKVLGYVNAVFAPEVVQQKRAERSDRYVRPLDAKRDTLIANVALRAGAEWRANGASPTGAARDQGAGAPGAVMRTAELSIPETFAGLSVFSVTDPIERTR
jgi:hypothetical protein